MLDGDGLGETAGDDGATLGETGAGEDTTEDSGDAADDRGRLDPKLDSAGDDSADENALDRPKLTALVGPDGELDVKLLPKLDVTKLDALGDGLGPGLNGLDNSDDSELGRLLDGDATTDARLDAAACEDDVNRVDGDDATADDNVGDGADERLVARDDA